MTAKRNAVTKRKKQVLSFSGGGDQFALGSSTPHGTKHPAAPIRGPPTLLTVDEAAQLLRCSKSCLNKWRGSGGGPVYVQMGGRIRYRLTDLQDFIDAGARRSTSQQTAVIEAAE